MPARRPNAPERWAVVMAGGSGTRFWPASRVARPKQLLPLGGSSTSLLAATIARLAGIVPIERTLVVTAAHLAEATRRELPQLPADNLLAEPAPRNTAPCIGWATRVISQRDPAAV
ncbi:MAG: sugar phosphate nucleotidyltransferase, partial [Polyangiales bacterium]